MSGKRLAAAALVVGLIVGWFGRDVVNFVKIDACLDSGGAWNYQREVCSK